MAARFRSLVIGYDRSWCPGYGWIFPSPGGRFNIGVGLFTEHSTERRLKDDPTTLEELATQYGVSRERVRQIEVRAFEKLQKAMRAAATDRNLDND